MKNLSYFDKEEQEKQRKIDIEKRERPSQLFARIAGDKNINAQKVSDNVLHYGNLYIVLTDIANRYSALIIADAEEVYNDDLKNLRYDSCGVIAYVMISKFMGNPGQAVGWNCVWPAMQAIQIKRNFEDYYLPQILAIIFTELSHYR